MAMNTITWAKTVGLTMYEKPMILEAKKDEWEYKKLFSVGKMDKGQWQTYQHAGFGAANLTDELELVQFEDASELDPVVLTAVKYTKGYVVSEELEEDNTQIPGLLGSWAKSVGRGHRYAVNVSTASIFNNAFSSSYTGWDGVEMCGSHTTNSGTTIDNDLGPSSFSWDTYWDMVKYFDYQIYDEAGLPMTDTPRYLVLHPSQRDVVEAINKSPGKYDSADLHANTLKGISEPVYCRLLDSTTAFFLVGEMMKDHLLFKQRKPVTTKWSDAFENIGKKCRTHQRFAYGFTDYRFVVGNPGA